MTMQAPDYMGYHGRNFKIIDTEKNHSLIDSAPFHIPQNDGDAWSWSTACQRGYTAEYIIREDGSLWGRKFITVPGDTPYSRKKLEVTKFGQVTRVPVS